MSEFETIVLLLLTAIVSLISAWTIVVIIITAWGKHDQSLSLKEHVWKIDKVEKSEYS